MELNPAFKDDSFKPSAPVNIKELLDKYLYHWPVFLTGICLALGLAFLYLRYTPSVYDVKASLLIKDSSRDNISGIKELNMFSDTRTVENEMVILSSRPLMQQVVGNLDLSITYFTRGKANSTDIYAMKPVDIHLLEPANPELNGRTYLFEPLNERHFKISDEKDGSTFIGSFDKIQKLPFGKCLVRANALARSYYKNPFVIKVTDAETRAGELLQNLDVSIVNRQTSLIGLSLKETIPSRGKDILNNLVVVYNNEAIREKNRSTANSMAFIADRLNSIKAELRDIELEEQNFRTSHGLTEISSQAEIYQEKLKGNDERVNDLNFRIENLRGLAQFAASDQNKAGAAGLDAVGDPTVDRLFSEYGRARERYYQLQQTTGESHPQVINAREKLKDTREELVFSINNAIRTVERQRAQLSRANNEIRSSIKDVPEIERQLIDIRRQKVIKEALYLSLLQKQEEGGLSSATTLPDSRVIESASASMVPIEPKRRNIFMIALLMGLSFPVGYVFLKDSLNTKVISNKDISERTDTPILGDVIYQDDASSIVFTNNSRTPIAEQFRALRTNLQYTFGRNLGSRVTLFTSSMSGEGKSFVSSNLAIALAMADRRVVILELDLRKPKISKYLNLRNRVGLSNYLIGKADREDIIQPSGVHANLSVISSGPVPPNPAELMEQNEIEELILWLKTQYDDIIIDSPPIGLVTDALILARFADATMYIVRHGVTLKSQVSAIDSLYREQKFNRLNIIHNGIKVSGRYGYSYEGNYGYGYGNGYAGYAYYEKPKGGRNIAQLTREVFKRF